jgi:hypothetical protein
VTTSRMRESGKVEKGNRKDVRDKQSTQREETLLKLHAHRGQNGDRQSMSHHTPNGVITVTPSIVSSTESANSACGSAYEKAVERMKKDQEGTNANNVTVAKYVNQKAEEIAAWIGDLEWPFVCFAAVTLMVLVIALLYVHISRYWKDG